jgi:hypothetical protein
MTRIQDLADLNRHHRLFWQLQNLRTDELMADPAVCETALAVIKADSSPPLPAYDQNTLEMALATADSSKRRIRRRLFSELGRRGGQSKGQNALQSAINDFVSRNRDASLASLEKHLKGSELVDDWTLDTIVFIDFDGRLKDAARSGLKHRLSRAHKLLQKS